MTGRFQIEELIYQDERGVIFNAFDSLTRQSVALRRFFPFGANGRGLKQEEQEAYKVAVARLAAVRHPALRTVIAGGCDPVDGIPYLATEWVDGGPLDLLVAQRPLAPAEAAVLLIQVFEVSILLSEVLAEEAVWVETDPRTIIARGQDSGRGFTFLILPMKGLGAGDGENDLEPILTLAEDVLHWHGQLVSDQAGSGMGRWLKWLRGAKAGAGLAEALERLKAATGAAPPPAATAPVRQPAGPRKLPVPSASRTPKAPWLAAAVLILLIAAAGVFLNFRREEAIASVLASPTTGAREREEKPPPARAIDRAGFASPAPSPADSSTERVNQLAKKLSDESAERDAAVAARRREIIEAGGVHQVDDRDLLIENRGREVVLQGTLAFVRLTGSGKTLYLEFSPDAPASEARGAVSGELARGELSEQALNLLIGRTIRLRGTVELESAGRAKRPLVRFVSRSAIELVE